MNFHSNSGATLLTHNVQKKTWAKIFSLLCVQWCTNKGPKGLHSAFCLCWGSNRKFAAVWSSKPCWTEFVGKCIRGMFTHLFIISSCSSKRLVFCPLCTFFAGLQTLIKCLSPCSLMMMYESYPEDVVRSGDVQREGWQMKSRLKKKKKCNFETLCCDGDLL